MSNLVLSKETFVAGSQALGARQSGFTTILAKLLGEADVALETDRAAAKLFIARASALLQAERDREETQATPPQTSLARGGLAPWQIRRVKEHVDANLMTTIRLKDFVDITRLSTSHFSRAFKSSFNETPYAYVVRRRMERAKEMMLATDEPLSQVALACGLSDQAHLSRLFRRVVGATPNVWRRQRRGAKGIVVAADSSVAA